MNISIFENSQTPSGAKDVSIESFLNGVKLGKWKDKIELIRGEKIKEKRQNLKRKILPLVTVSGVFSHRSLAGLKEHSGLICIDIDEVNVEETWERLRNDEYIYSLFKSASGNGIACIVKIEGKKHLDAFLGIEYYFANQYEI